MQYIKQYYIVLYNNKFVRNNNLTVALTFFWKSSKEVMRRQRWQQRRRPRRWAATFTKNKKICLTNKKENSISFRSQIDPFFPVNNFLLFEFIFYLFFFFFFFNLEQFNRVFLFINSIEIWLIVLTQTIQVKWAEKKNQCEREGGEGERQADRV